MRTRRSQSSGDPVSPRLAEARSAEAAHLHRSVLLHEAIESLALKPDDVVVDATLGGAGHARAIAEKLGTRGTFIGFDLDADAISRAKEILEGVAPKVHLIQADFRHLAEELAKLGVLKPTKILFDLGMSSYQLGTMSNSGLPAEASAQAGRGFSFMKDEPLLMTYSFPKEGQLTAQTIVNEWGEQSLADIIFGWGEERYAKRIARAIVERRARHPFKTAHELGEVIKHAVPTAHRRGSASRRIHPATRTFQALRIAVNDELGALSLGLKAAWSMLAPKSRIAVIAFHSIEDRIVKRTFVEWEKAGEAVRITKKPLVPTREEIVRNPRSRSAKLRVIEKS